MARWLVVEAAWRALRYSEALRGFWQRVMHGQKSRKKIAIVAAARKLLTIMYAMLKTGEVWNERLAAGFACFFPSRKASADNVSEVTQSKSKRGGEAATPAPCIQ